MDNNELPADDAALAALLGRKRADLAARLDALRAEARAIETALASIDGTLRLIDPAALPAAPPTGVRPVRATRAGARFAQGECLALMTQALREAPQPLSTTELVRAVMTRKGLPASDEDSVRLAVRYVLRSGGGANAGIAATDPAAHFPRWTLK
jgi:hypothetical protein